tara:strand:- start:3743 stop:3970 length:228 start_codon:yes stop_codon:yes gene_type:complete
MEQTTKTTKTTNQTENTIVSPFTQAANMDLTGAVGVLAQASQLAQKAGVLTVNDAVLVARALELVRGQEQNDETA